MEGGKGGGGFGGGDALGTGSSHIPAERDLDELHEVGGDLGGAEVGEVRLGAEVAVLQDAAGLEQVHEGERGVRVRRLDLVAVAVSTTTGAERVRQLRHPVVRRRPR